VGLPQAKVSQMLRGQFRGISEDRMMRCLTALGQDVQIVVKPARKAVPDRFPLRLDCLSGTAP